MGLEQHQVFSLDERRQHDDARQVEEDRHRGVAPSLPMNWGREFEILEWVLPINTLDIDEGRDHPEEKFYRVGVDEPQRLRLDLQVEVVENRRAQRPDDKEEDEKKEEAFCSSLLLTQAISSRLVTGMLVERTRP